MTTTYENRDRTARVKQAVEDAGIKAWSHEYWSCGIITFTIRVLELTDSFTAEELRTIRAIAKDEGYVGDGGYPIVIDDPQDGIQLMHFEHA